MRNTYLNLSDEDRDYLVALTRKRTIQARIVEHAKILLLKLPIPKMGSVP